MDKKQSPLYANIKEIFNSIQGNTIPSYQGLQAFWMDPEVFISASLYGHRLIAPKEGSQETTSNQESKSCCGSGNNNPAVTDPAVNAVQQPPSSSAIGDCWPSGGSGGGSIPSTVKRSDKSAIIYGLKGKYPFDGSIFPPLMWDAENKPSSQQIQTIADWIDSDCPITKEDQKSAEITLKLNSLQNKKIALAKGHEEHQISSNKTNKDFNDYKGLAVRKEIHSLTAEELETFRSALRCMFQYNDFYQDERSFDFWARIHTNSCQHGWEQFLPWHRLYLYFFEQKLQDYDASIALPYWSWSDYADENKKTFNNTKLDLGILPDAYGCFITEKALEKLITAKSSDGKSLFSKKQITALTKMVKSGEVYQSGPRFLVAAEIDYDVINQNGSAVWNDQVRTIYNTLKEVNPLWFPNRWPGALAGLGETSIYPTPQSIENLLSIEAWPDFAGGPGYDHHYGSLEMVHNGMHLFSGGTNPNYPGNLSGSTTWQKKYEKIGITSPDPQSFENPQNGWMTDNRTTAFDPIFWAHHGNVDRIWSLWQERHSGVPEDMDGALAPWPMSVKDTMSTKKLGYIYMKDTKFYDVDSNIGLEKFKSATTKLSSSTIQSFRKAEIKLHRVRRGNLPNTRIHVFINEPEANLNTATEGNDNFIDTISTFHGSCYGGPGHCNLPLDKTRASDLRPLNHHEPRNFKIDATAAVKKMVKSGKKDISIQLLAVGLDGKPIDNALYIDGVSLNILD